ncbi:MAG: hypothetical protein NW223_08410 [Hyphomicrobiaceae bacterium]|nr:hypothetical protein [Hyphomicrobiaceae bacterium]
MTARAAPLLALLLAGCAAAMPGYDPLTGGVADRRKAVGAEMDGEGRYILTAAEREYDCPRLSGGIVVTIARLRDRERSEPVSGVSTGMRNVVSPLFGGSGSNSPEAEAGRERAKIAAYNSQLVQKGCKPVDIEAEYAKPLDQMVRY